ncbi:centromere protein R isoform X3 [Odocoileus virginianus]
MSPIASPRNSKKQENRNGPSNGKRENLNHLSINKRKESTMQDNEFMVLLSKVEKSSEEFMEIMQNLSSIQALKRSKELENLIGIPHASCVFKREMQKTKELMTNVIKQKLFKKKNSGLPNKVPWMCTRLLCPWNFQGKNIGVGCYFLLQIFPAQGLNLQLLHCRWILYY